ncbi:hypothetical protein JKP88DRAFT_253127 [Tribonema minus]|uniref:Phosphomevalonate kinase n=1 Tax=Tribonema minus TaxID=303371 RepID=A0A836CMM7_9STRA|nr:hypothetical protein JKP88DRAFT_253127 [Tribonema minus]
MAPRLIVGLVAPKAAGKDTFANAVGDDAKDFAKLSFADPIKAACRSIFSLDVDDLEDRVKKESVDDRWGVSRRKMMQVLGTECVRANFGEDHWIRHLRMRLDACQSQIAIVTDVRFHNEAQFLRDYEGCRAVLIRITRPRSTDVRDEHASESAIADINCDVTVLNDGTVQDLQTKACGILMRLVAEL